MVVRNLTGRNVTLRDSSGNLYPISAYSFATLNDALWNDIEFCHWMRMRIRDLVVTGVAGGGSGGGDGGGDPTVVQNLYVQQTQPSAGALLLDTLWIPINPDGTAKGVALWQVYTGTGITDGFNLFIQEVAPTPTVDALWIPTNPDGTPKYLDEWIVFTGRGTTDGVGNPNLYIGQTLPTSPVVGSLFIPLNPDETPKSADQWRVYA